jgi:hypothetical protein
VSSCSAASEMPGQPAMLTCCRAGMVLLKTAENAASVSCR